MEYTDLYTRVEIPKRKPISADDRPVLLGSCFTDNIGERMLHCGWQACVNPCGVLYNPRSIYSAIDYALFPNLFGYEICTEPLQGRWFSWLISTKFSAETEQQAEQNAAEAFAALRNGIKNSNVIIITLGTAWIYNLKFTGMTVGNCHKAPANMFDRHRMSVAEIESDLKAMITALCTNRKKPMRVIFTVSPIRHFKDGAVENTLSKAALITAIHNLIDSGEVKNIEYFPAYEIMMDELRDYRFYAADRVHPSDQAIDYIWQRFCDTYITPEDLEKMHQAEKAWRRTLHRPIQPDTNPEGEMPK